MNRALPIWIVLGLLVLVILAVLAFRTPDTVDEDMEQTATTTAEVIDRGAARATAAAELTALQARIESGETYDALADDFAEVRADLARTYENLEGEAAQEWAELDAAFDDFEASARAGTGNVLDSLADLIARFSADVRVETSAE